MQGGNGTTFTGNVDMVGDLNTTGALTNNGKDVGSTHNTLRPTVWKPVKSFKLVLKGRLRILYLVF